MKLKQLITEENTKISKPVNKKINVKGLPVKKVILKGQTVFRGDAPVPESKAIISQKQLIKLIASELNIKIGPDPYLDFDGDNITIGFAD